MNSFGKLFRVSIFGESHGESLGIVIDGCPAGISLRQEDFEADFSRRKSGAKGTTPRQEPDKPLIMSGIFNGLTTGAPVMILFKNTNTRSRDYSQLKDIPRPGHADLTGNQKYGGYQDYRGGGHFSGRLTLGLVAAGVLAKKIIFPAKVSSSILEVGGSSDIESALDRAIEMQDSIGGIIECSIAPVPVGLGEPFFDSVEAHMSHMIFSIPAIKGIEFGSGFAAAKMTGSEHNDTIIDSDGTTGTNHAGGINGGISNGNDICFRVAVKPTSSTHQTQHTMNIATGQMVNLSIEGRHDTCIALRVPVVVEAAAAIVMADLMLQAQQVERIVKHKSQ